MIKDKKEEKLKGLILKKYFKSGQHKKIIIEAAKKSAKDQKDLSRRYNEMTANAS